MSVPIAHGASPAATAAALPPEEPPGTRPRSHGFSTGPKPEFSFEEPIANSSWLVLPEQRRAGLRQLRDDRGGVRRPVALEDPRARLAGDALGAEQILDGERHAGERPSASAVRAAARSATQVNAFSSSAAARSR